MRLEVTWATPATRFVIVHYHIMKNGGSTLESILEREFPGAFATFHGPDANSTLDGSHLQAFLTQYPHVSAVSSHHLRYPIPAVRHLVLFDCCFLRHPLERIHSLCEHLQRTNSSDWLSQRARRQSPREFMQTLIEQSPHLISEVQVRCLANAGVFNRPAHADDLQKAIETLHSMAIPGLVENFDESLVAAEYFLRPAFPNVTFEYLPRNVGRPLGITPAQRQERLSDLWGADVYNELVRMNRLDLELFHRAGQEIVRRIDLVPGLDARLAGFKSRCSALRPSAACAS